MVPWAHPTLLPLNGILSTFLHNFDTVSWATGSNKNKPAVHIPNFLATKYSDLNET